MDEVEINLTDLALYSKYVHWLTEWEKGNTTNKSAADLFTLMTGHGEGSHMRLSFEAYLGGLAEGLKSDSLTIDEMTTTTKKGA